MAAASACSRSIAHRSRRHPRRISRRDPEELDAALPPTWSRANPVDIVGDADSALLRGGSPKRSWPTGQRCRAGPERADCARIGSRHGGHRRGIDSRDRREGVTPESLSSRSGSVMRAPAETRFERAGIPHFGTEADAVQGFMHLVRYGEASDNLMKMSDRPSPAVCARRCDCATGRRGCRLKDAPGSTPSRYRTPLRQAYSIPVVPVTLARTQRGGRGGCAFLPGRACRP